MKVSIEWAKNDLLSKLPVTIFIDERCATRLTDDLTSRDCFVKEECVVY